jgi:ribonuclease HII
LIELIPPLKGGIWNEGRILYGGTDEVGRGALAGPVVAVCVAWDPRYSPPWRVYLKDSKQLVPKKRLEMAERIVSDPHILYGIGYAEVEEIDRLNILKASLLAMERAVSLLPPLKKLWVDGNQPLSLSVPQSPTVDADQWVPWVSAASILAKVFRDHWMSALHALYPPYGFHTNKGYGTQEHLQALKRFGPTPVHRRSFRPVSQLTLFSGV